MNKKRFLITASIILAGCMTAATADSILDPDSQMVNGINQVGSIANSIQNQLGQLIQYYGINSSAPLTNPSPDLATIINSAAGLLTGAPAMQSLSLGSVLTQLQTTINLGQSTTRAQTMGYYARSLGLSNPFPSSPSSKTPMIAPNPTDNTLNFENFITPLSYSSASTQSTNTNSAGFSGLFPSTQTTSPVAQQINQAKNFINFATGIVIPLKVLSNSDYLTNLDQKHQDEYMNTIRMYSSVLSVGLGNLQQMYNRRVPTPSLAAAGNSNGQPTSIAQVENYMATRRLNSQWISSMDQASPITVQRETLYLLAEMNYQIYQMRQQQERLLATQSVDMLTNLNAMVKSMAEEKPNSNASSTTTANS